MIDSPTSFRPDRQSIGTLEMDLITHRESVEALDERLEKISKTLPHEREPYLTAESFDELYSGSSEAAQQVATFLQRRGLEAQSSADGSTVTARGPLELLEREFQTRFVGVDARGERRVMTARPPAPPTEIAASVNHVEFSDESGVAEAEMPLGGEEADSERHYKVSQVTAAYGFPDNKGQGQVVGILTLGGGYAKSDLEAFCRLEGIPYPDIVDVEDKAKNVPAPVADIEKVLSASGFETRPLPQEALGTAGEMSAMDLDPKALEAAIWTVETTADIQIVAAAAPEAKIVVIFTTTNKLDRAQSMRRALGAQVDYRPRLEEELRPDIISCSWGEYEDGSPKGNLSRDLLDQAMQRAAVQGVSVCCATGNYGGGRVYYPACNPWVLACGGSAIVSPPGTEPMVEQVWREPLGSAPVKVYPASGGGVSASVAAPEWQTGIGAAEKTGVPGFRIGRAVPDVAAHARAASGYRLVIGDLEVAMGGTSCATPLWAGLLARINVANADLAERYRVGFLTSLPYLRAEQFAGALRSITEGSNGRFSASPVGWDACTGLGRPVGDELAKALRGGA